jgi:hypothetical protein
MAEYIVRVGGVSFLGATLREAFSLARVRGDLKPRITGYWALAGKLKAGGSRASSAWVEFYTDHSGAVVGGEK